MSHSTGYPIFTVAFLPNRNRILVGGGGGANRSGVKNAITLLDVDESLMTFNKVSEHLFPSEDDGCMSLAVHPKRKAIIAGVNQNSTKVKEGENDNCRLLHLNDKEFVEIFCTKSLFSVNATDFQKTAKFSMDGEWLAAGSTDGTLTIFKYPNLDVLTRNTDKGEIVDLDWHPAANKLVYIKEQQCQITPHDLSTKHWMIEKPTFSGSSCEFRACRFGKYNTEHLLFLGVNSKDRKRAFIAIWAMGDTVSEWSLKKSKAVASKPMTSIAISPSGDYLAIGCSDLTVTILEARTLKILKRVANIHSFAVTSLDFSPTSQTLVTGSADGTCRAIAVPHLPSKSSFLFWTFFFLFIFLGGILIILGMIAPEEQDL